MWSDSSCMEMLWMNTKSKQICLIAGGRWQPRQKTPFSLSVPVISTDSNMLITSVSLNRLRGEKAPDLYIWAHCWFSGCASAVAWLQRVWLGASPLCSPWRCQTASVDPRQLPEVCQITHAAEFTRQYPSVFIRLHGALRLPSQLAAQRGGHHQSVFDGLFI